MPWVKLDDRFHEDPRVIQAWQASRVSIGLYVMALTYSGAHLLDGNIPEHFVVEKVPGTGDRRKAIAALVDAGLWEPQDNGWKVRNYLKFNPSKAEVEHGRSIDRFRKELTRDGDLIAAIRDRDGDTCRYCGIGVNWKDRRGTSGGTYDHIIPVVAGGANSFDNVVVACRNCNGKKGPRTPEEAGMTLMRPGSHLAAVPSISTPDLPAGVDHG